MFQTETNLFSRSEGFLVHPVFDILFLSSLVQKIHLLPLQEVFQEEAVFLPLVLFLVLALQVLPLPEKSFLQQFVTLFQAVLLF